jgi:hypothetical protein
MSDQRPPELTSHIAAESEKNDRLILDALAQLGDPRKRGKRKPIVAVVCEMTGLSRNTIRNRTWALKQLKDIKRKLKNDAAPEAESQPTPNQPENTPDKLRERIGRLLQQNVLLYEHVLQQQETIARKDKEIAGLKARKNLSIVPPVGRTNE